MSLVQRLAHSLAIIDLDTIPYPALYRLLAATRYLVALAQDDPDALCLAADTHESILQCLERPILGHGPDTEPEF